MQGNTIQDYGEVGIQFNARQGNATIDATVLGNTIREPGTAAQGAFGAIWVNSGALSTDTNTVNIAIGGTAAADKNTLTNSDPNNATDVFLDTQSDSGAPTFINLYRNGSTAVGLGRGALSQYPRGRQYRAVGPDHRLHRRRRHQRPGEHDGPRGPAQPPLLAAAGGVAAAKPTPVVSSSSPT